MISFLNVEASIKPNRLKDRKTEQYHLDYARYCLANINSGKYYDFIEKTERNYEFYKGDGRQWMYEEDTDNFFTDEDGNYKNRIMIERNIIQPLVNYYTGSIMSSSVDVKVKSIDNRSTKRRQDEMKRLEAYQKLADIPFIGDAIKSRVPIGADFDETMRLFETGYVDEIFEDINIINKSIAEQIKFKEILIECSKSMALSGMGIYKNIEVNGEYDASSVDPKRFLWDTDARKPDLSDASFMGEWYHPDPVEIFERYELSGDVKEKIEESFTRGNMTQNFRHTDISGSRPTLVEMYWLDVKKMNFGWVEVSKGVHEIHTLDSKNQYLGKKLSKKSDLTPDQLALTDGKVFTSREFDDIRFCVFLIGTSLQNHNEDIVLEYGSLPYQERERHKPSRAKWPYKVRTWFYDEGDVISPVDVAISPQRLVNRVASIVESKLNTSGGQGAIVAEQAVSHLDQGEVAGKINRGETLFVRGDSIPNVTGRYDASNTQGQYLFAISEQFEKIASQSTGVNDPMLGMPVSNEQAVGVTNSMVQRGSIMQQPFFEGIRQLAMDAYESMSTMGRRIYSDNPDKLNIVSPDGSRMVVASKELALEEIKCYVSITGNEQNAIEKGKGLLLQLFGAQLIDNTFFAEHFGKSDEDEISKAYYKYQLQVQMAKEAAAKVNSQKEAAETALLQEEIAGQKERENLDRESKEIENKDKLDRIERNNIRSNQAKIK